MSNQLNHKKDNLADIRKILRKALKSWYFFLLVLMIAFALAYFKNKYTRPVFRVETKVLVKSKASESSAASFLYGTDISNDAVAQGMETYILKSYPLVKKVVKQLNFVHVYTINDEIGSKEAYGWEPVEMEIDSLTEVLNYGKSFQLVVTDKDHYRFFSKDDEGGAAELYEFGETVDYKGFVFRASKKRDYDISRVINKEFTFSLINPHNITNAYVNRLIIDGGTDGSILDMALVGTNPAKEIDFIRKLIELYVESELERKNEAATKTINFISQELKRITDSLMLIENRKVSIRQQSSAQLSQSSVQLYSRLDEAEIQTTQYDNKIRIYNQLISTVNSSYNFDDLSGLAAIGVDDPGLRNLINQLVSEQEQIDQAERGAGQNTNNPYIRRARDNVKRLKTSIVESVNNLISTTRQNKNRIEGRARKIRGEIYTSPEAQQNLVNIERLNKISENLYVLYNSKKAEAEVAKASASSDLQIIDPPMIKGTAKDDKRNYLVALFLGLTIPMGFIVIKDFLSNKVAGKDDIESRTNIPVLGQIWRNGKSKDMLAVYKNPKSIVSESFRSMRSNLNFFTSDIDKKVFVLTSSISGEGKTFTSINLSTVFAFSSKKVVLIGADLRRPKIFGDFSLNNDVGLSNYLAGSAFKSEIIQPTEIPYLDIISSGPVPPNPSELLMNKKMSELIKELESDYDYIIIDTAPLGLVTDAFILMNHAHHTIFLVRQNYTPLDAVNNVNDLYESGKLKKVSILLNDVKDDSNNYGYGYGYYQEKK